MDRKCLSDRIKTMLQSRIENGDLAPGDTLPSEHELAHAYNTTRSHARQALRDLQREGYIERSQGKRSVVTGLDRRSQVHMPLVDNAVAIAVPHYQSHYCRSLIAGFMSAVTKMHYQTITYNLQFNPENEAVFLSRVLRSGLRGLAIWVDHCIPETREALLHIQEARFPVVLLDRYFPGVALDSVSTQNELLGYSLTRRLVEAGHRQIAFFSNGTHSTSEQERHAGYVRAMSEAGLAPSSQWKGEVAIEETDIYDAVARVMAFKQPPTAFYCTHDAIASAIADCLKELGYRVPEDAVLAACDDDLCTLVRGIPMERMAQPGLAIGRKAAELMIARMNNPEKPVEKIELPPEPPVEYLNPYMVDSTRNC